MQVTPKMSTKNKKVDYADLKPLDAFLYNGDLYIKITYGDQLGICLSSDVYCESMCGVDVIPVDAKLTWTYKKLASKKKKK